MCDHELVIDQHQELVLNASSSTDNVGITNYTWIIHMGTANVTLYGALNSLVIDDAGSYTVDLNVSDAIGNWKLKMLNITVRDITAPVPGVDMVSEVNVGNSTVFNASNSEDNVGIVHYQWSFRYDGQDIILEGKEAEFIFNIPGTYNITLTIRDAEGNEAEETYGISVTSPKVVIDDDDGSKYPQWVIFVLIIGGIIMLLIAIIGIFLFLRSREDVMSWTDEE
jgi:PKD repeat protein